MRTFRVAFSGLVAVFLAGSAAAQGKSAIKLDINPIVWRVNGDPVHAAEISMAMQGIVAQTKRAGGPVPGNQALMQMATQRVIDQKLLAQEARRLAVRNDQQRLQARIAQMEQQAGGRAALEQTLAAAGSTYEQAVQAVTEADLVMQLVDSQIAPTVKIARPDVQAYYDENAARYTAAERVHARHLVFSAIEGDPPATFDAARAKAAAARQRAVAGEDFAALAKELSEDPAAPRGGDLGFFTLDQMEEPFAAAVAALQPGQLSEVVQTRYGFHVIKLEARRPAGRRSLDEVERDIAAALHQEEVGERIAGLLDTLRKSGKIEAEVHPGTAATAGGD